MAIELEIDKSLSLKGQALESVVRIEDLLQALQETNFLADDDCRQQEVDNGILQIKEYLSFAKSTITCLPNR